MTGLSISTGQLVRVIGKVSQALGPAYEELQQALPHERYIGVDLVNPRFDKLAEGYGAKGYYVERAQDIGDAVKDALAQTGPSVIEIPVAEYFPLPAPTPPSR